MLVSVIVPTYKDLNALELILEAFDNQTYKTFEVIIAEDDDSQDTRDFLSTQNRKYNINHVFHENRGNRKASIMNRALLYVKGKYVIFIDGDTIPYSTFIEAHVSLSAPKTILCGRRVNLGDKVSSDLREKKMSAQKIEKNYFKMYNYLKSDNMRHYEQGIAFKVNSFIYNLIQKFGKNINLLASNYSCFKEDIFEVNGFDENLPYAPHRDDTDLQWRLVRSGCVLKSCKYCANLFHLNHARSERREEGIANLKIIEEKKRQDEYVALVGIYGK